MKEGPLLPENDARESALFFVVCTLCFLAALAALTAKATYGAAEGWTAEVEGEMTVRLRDVDRRAGDEAQRIIEAIPGVISARVMTPEEIEELLVPTFGQTGFPAGLPLPLLIAVETEPAAADVAPNTARRLTEEGFSAVVDEHAEWAGDVRRALGVLRLAALSAVALLIATALSVIAFATHAALLARRDIVELLHLSGARDRFIAALFERRFWMLGLRAGAVGALAALGGAAAMIFVAQSRGGRANLLPQLSLDLLDILILVLTPIVAGSAARLATRFTVMRALKGKDVTA